jgi:predicted dehydrogenase
MMSCKVVMVGAGNMAREHVRAFAAVAGVKLAGIHSRTRAKAEALAQEFGVAGVFGSVAELYECTRADLAVVTVFETAMSAVSRACFEFPWAVLLEKPPGCNLREAQEIHAAAQAQHRRVFVGLNRRFLSSTRAAVADLAKDSGPRYVHVQDQQSLAMAAALGHPPAVVENWMYANSIHLIDYFGCLARGKVRRVQVVAPWEPREPRVVLAKIEFESGDLGLYEGVWNGPGPWAVSVTTPAKRWELRPLEQAAFQLAGTRQLQPVPAHEWDKHFKPGFRLQAEQVVAAACQRATEAVTLDEALGTMRLISAIYQP